MCQPGLHRPQHRRLHSIIHLLLSQSLRDTGRNGLFTCCFNVCNTSKLKVYKTNDFGLKTPLDLIPRYFFRANCTTPSRTKSTRKSLSSATNPWVTLSHMHTHTRMHAHRSGPRCSHHGTMQTIPVMYNHLLIHRTILVNVQQT